MSRQPESRLQRSIRKALGASFPGSFWFKVHGGPFVGGIPDLVGCVRGRFIALEVKRPGKRATILQLTTINLINSAGGVATVVTSVDEAIQAVVRSI